MIGRGYVLAERLAGGRGGRGWAFGVWPCLLMVLGGCPAHTAPASGRMKVIRGGSWGYVAPLCRCGAHEAADPDARDAYVGLRVVMESP